ncbi:MAG: glycosyltransferase family 4 protein [Bryobacterales bacterium]|nr:glycosyltransferase family 4 protein [Bryobacterales bacterium]
MSAVVIIHNIPIHYKHLLFSALVHDGIDLDVLFLASGSKDRIEYPDLLNATYRFRIGFDGPFEAIPFWGSARYIWRSLSEFQPRAVIIGGWDHVGAWTAWLWCLLHRCPAIFWGESNSFDRRRVLWKELGKKIFLRQFVACQVYGTSNAEYLTQLGMPSERIWVKRAVADVELFRLTNNREKRRSPRKVLLFVGRLAPEKNLEFVLAALPRLSPAARRGLLLRIVGYGPLENSLRLQAESLGLNDIVEFAGPRRHRELPEAYHSADVLVLPSTSEPWGLTVNEGMLCGLPVIVSDRCGCARDLVNPECGWSFDPYDQASFCRILEGVEAMPLDDIRRMGRNGAELALEYSPEKCAERVRGCLEFIRS